MNASPILLMFALAFLCHFSSSEPQSKGVELEDGTRLTWEELDADFSSIDFDGRDLDEYLGDPEDFLLGGEEERL